MGSVRGGHGYGANSVDSAVFSSAVGGGTVGIAVAPAVNVLKAHTKGYTGNNAHVNSNPFTADGSQSVLVGAGNDFHHVALAAGAGFGTVGVAPGVDVTVLHNDTGASIDAGAVVKAKGDVRVDAHASEDILMVGLGIGGGVVGVGGGVSVLSLSNTTYASIAGTVSAGGDVAVSSSGKSSVLVIAGGLGVGFVGVGASVGVMGLGEGTETVIAGGG